MNKWIIILIATHAVGAYIGISLIAYWLMRKYNPCTDLFFDGRFFDRFLAIIWPITAVMYALYLISCIIVLVFSIVTIPLRMAMDTIDSATGSKKKTEDEQIDQSIRELYDEDWPNY